MSYASQVGAGIVIIYLYLMASFIEAYFFTKVFTFKIKKVIVILFWGGLPFALNTATLFERTIPESVVTIMEIAIHITLLCSLPQDRWRYRCAIFVLRNVLVLIVNAVCLLLMVVFGKSMEDVAQDLPFMIIGAIIMTAVYFVIFLSAIALLKKIKSGIPISFHLIILFIAFPLLQMFIVIEVYFLLKIIGEHFLFFITAWIDEIILLITHFAVADLLLYFAIKDLRKKKRLKEEYEFLQRQRQEEYAHMQAMIAGEDERRKFYHDINNNLSVIQTLIADGHCHEAQNIMDSVCEKIKDL